MGSRSTAKCNQLKGYAKRQMRLECSWRAQLGSSVLNAALVATTCIYNRNFVCLTHWQSASTPDFSSCMSTRCYGEHAEGKDGYHTIEMVYY